MKKLIAIVLALVMTLSMAFAITEQIQNKQKNYEELQEEMERLQRQNRENESSLNETIQRLSVLQREASSLEEDMALLKDEIMITENEIDRLDNDIVESSEEIDAKKTLFYERIRTMYKSKKTGYLEILLGSGSIEDMMARVDMLQRVYHHDTELIQFLVEEKELLESTKVTVEEKKTELLGLMNALQEKQAKYDQNIVSLQSTRGQIQKDISLVEQQLDVLNADAKKLEDEIKKLQTQLQYEGGQMMWPIPGYYRITSYFGYRMHPILKVEKLHTGLDVGAPTGANVIAASGGTVIYADWYGGYGKMVMIDHGKDASGKAYVTVYGHNSQLVVRAGDKVTKGQVIAKIGSTGMSTGPHLHFEVRINGEYVDPLDFVKNN